MAMKKKKIIYIFVITIIFSVILFSLLKDSKVIKSDNLFTKISEKENQGKESAEKKSNDESNQKTISANDIEKDKISKYFYGVNVSDMKSTVMADGYQYKVNNVKVTKEKEDFVKTDWPQVEYDSHGNIINDYSFVILDIDINFVEEIYKGLDIYLNNMTLYAFNNNGDFENSYEVVSSNNGNDYSQKNYFGINLEPGETLTRKIVFIVMDKELKNNQFVLLIDNHGALGLHTEDKQCIMLELEE
ncbi:MAG: hypothetical protein ACFWTJ_04705 [Lachnoclostridium sp.]